MIKYLFKFVLVIGAVVGVSVVLAVGQAQATIIGPFEGEFEDPWDFKYEWDDGILKDFEGSGGLAGYFGYNFSPDEKTLNVWWDFSSLNDGTHVDGLTVKAGRDVFHYKVATDQLIVGEGTILSRNNRAISNLAVSVPDGSIMWLLGPSLIALGVFGRKRAKKLDCM
jgi:hypothetical protein